MREPYLFDIMNKALLLCRQEKKLIVKQQKCIVSYKKTLKDFNAKMTILKLTNDNFLLVHIDGKINILNKATQL